jgi:hypothetical protein
MGGAFSTCGGRKSVHRVKIENIKYKNYLEVIDIDSNIILKLYYQEIKWEGVDWSHLSHGSESVRLF